MQETATIEKFLRDHAIRPSYQRVQIYKYIKENKTHPTVDTIYTDLHPVIPTFSKTTVYNTMKLFMDKGLVQALTIEEGETRFDGDTTPHGHFKCRCCGSIYDLFFNSSDQPKMSQVPEDFLLESVHLYGWGLCGDCRKKGIE